MTDLVERLRERANDKFIRDAPILREAADEIERLLAAAKPFADYDWYDAELEDDSCQLVRHSGPITVGDWRRLRKALAEARGALAQMAHGGLV